MSKAHPTPKKNPMDVLARYGAYYHGDDDEFAHCFVLSGGRSVLLFQGLNTVFMSILEAPKKEFDQLADLLSKGIPAGWPKASYSGYDFVTNALDNTTASEIAVYGMQPGASPAIGQYYAAPPDSEIGKLVKAIAQVD